MDPQIEELKALIRQNTEMVQETHAMVKSMHRASIWGRVIKFVWVGLIIASAIGAFVYLGPYLALMQDLYGQIQEAIQQARDLGEQFQGGSER